MAKTFEELTEAAETIRTNTLPESNTANIVGQHLKDIIEKTEEVDNARKLVADNLSEVKENIISNSISDNEIIPPSENLEEISLGSSSVGIFENISNTDYHTSDYITLLENEEYLFVCNDSMASAFDHFRLYDSDKKLLYNKIAENGSYYSIKIKPSFGIKYIRFVSGVNIPNFLYKIISKLVKIDDYIKTSSLSYFNFSKDLENATKLEEIAHTNDSTGIFDEASGIGWITTDYIDISSYDSLILNILDGYNENYTIFKLYDSNKNVISTKKGESNPLAKGYYYIQYNKNIKYIRFSYPLESIARLYKKSGYNVLWVGTSIPAGCPYPQNSCNKLGWQCYNNAIGASGIVKCNGFLNNARDGKDLSESTAEKIARYSSYIGQGIMTQEYYNEILNYGYDKKIIPYIDGSIASCDVVVFDHGFNDRNIIDGNFVSTSAMATLYDNFYSQNFSLDRDDSAFNRGNYIEAFCFLLKKIYAINPNVKIIICSYLNNDGGGRYSDAVSYRGFDICKLLKKIASNFNFPFLNIADYIDFSYELIAGSENYLQKFNAKYGTSYTLLNYTGEDNPNGLISRYQYFCPDGVHPHTDLTGRSEKILTDNVYYLLKKRFILGLKNDI